MSAKWIRLKLSAIGARRLTLVAATAALALCTFSDSLATADVSHAGWPHTVTVAFASNAGGVLVGTDGNDMLLGGPGNATIYGGPGNDIVWGDQHPVPDNPSTQVYNLYGGTGDNWIYASHGTNHIFTGPDNNHVFAYFGRGTIVCGPGDDIVTLAKSSYHSYITAGCRHVVIGYP